MNQEEIKGKWTDIKGNVKGAYQKVKEDVIKIREDVASKKFTKVKGSKVKDGVQDLKEELKPELNKIKKDFVVGVDTAKKKVNDFKEKKSA
jgi:hypothetical protein